MASRERFAHTARLRLKGPCPPGDSGRICFHGQNLPFSQELRYLIADEETAVVLGERPSSRARPGDEPWKQTLAQALDLFDSAGRGPEGYGWLVTPNPRIAGRRPLSLLQEGAVEEGLVLIRRHLAGWSGSGPPPKR